MGHNLWQLAIDPMFGGDLFVTDRGTDQVRAIDPASLQQIRTIDVGDDPWGIDVDDSVVVVCCEDSHDVYFIDHYSWDVISLDLAPDADPRDVSIASGWVTVEQKLLMGTAYISGGQTSTGSPLYVVDIYSHQLLEVVTNVPGTNANVVTVEAQWPPPSAVDDLPGAVSLNVSAAPNPFNPRTTISFRLDEPAETRLVIFDVAGRMVRKIEAGTLGVGPNSIEWDGKGHTGQQLASGIYLVMVQAGEMLKGTKVVLVQ